jgi:phytol kinase
MTTRDIVGLVASYAYAGGLLIIAEVLRRRLGWPQDITRKLVHVGAGLWVWAQLALFTHWYVGIIPFATFILFNYILYRRRLLSALETKTSSPGTVYFAFSITVLYLALWRTGGAVDRAPIAIAAIMAMTVGDAAAALFGERWGRASFKVFGARRTWVGTLAMGLVSFAAIALTLSSLPGSALSPNSIALSTAGTLWRALAAAAIAATAEAVTPQGADNLTVPLLTGLALVLLGA